MSRPEAIDEGRWAARKRDLLGDAAATAVATNVAESVRALPLDSGPLHHELRILLRNTTSPASLSSLSGDAA